MEWTEEGLAAEHLELGRAVAAWIAEYARTLDGRSVSSPATPAELRELFNEPLPEKGVGREAILDEFARRIAVHAMHIPSPRYYGLFNPTPLPIAVWADALCSALNQNGAAWRNSPSASLVEDRVLHWLCELIGYGELAYGTLTSGGSEANLVALKCARDNAHQSIRGRGVRSGDAELVVYVSELAHYSLDKSVDILGLGRENLRSIRTDEAHHIDLGSLVQEIEKDKHEGRRPCCLVGVAGATSNGAIDPLDELARVAREYKLWFHVDAAYGGALAFSAAHKHLLRGIELADSVTIDPHKWMFVPFACGAVLLREGGAMLRNSFDVTPEYLSEKREGGADVPYDFFRYGQLGTRRFNALKCWMAIKFLGVVGYAEIIERQIELTRYFAARLRDTPFFELVGGVETAVCCFRWRPPKLNETDAAALDECQHRLQQRVEKSGEAWISTTVLKKRRVLRVNVNSILTSRRHLDDLLELLRRESELLLEEQGVGAG
ncbi:MAG TPA: pyridoxal-dependent decarboxylase [Pyrinomonadaceae bacterium]|nr:pyridoxal-dependent decarboxylase [Pyrinomonadaceae bacterium]